MRARLLYYTICAVVFVVLVIALIRNGFTSTPVAGLIGATAVIGLLYISMGNTREEHVRGRQLITRMKDVKITIPPGDLGFYWNGMTLPSAAKNEGFLYLGQTGSGKTICLSLLLHEALTKNSRAKAVIHDFKMNFPPLLKKFGVSKDRIKILNPYDSRSIAWNIQKDCVDWDAALEIAKGFVPELPNEGDSAFFRLGARFLLAGVMRYFLLESREKPDFKWSLRDLVECAKDKEAMQEMFSRHEELKTNLAYLNRDNDDILATLFQPLDEMGAIPNLWEGKDMFSFFDWAKYDNGEILVLGSDPMREGSLSVINRIMLNRMMKAVLTHRSDHKQESWFFLDEFHALGRITGFESFVSLCRDYKGCVAVATQDIAQIDALYGEKHRSTIMTNLVNKTFLKCSGDAAEWASKQIGQREVRVTSDSDSISTHGLQTGEQRSDQMKPIVIPTEFDLLPMFYEADSVYAYATSPYLGDAVRLILSKELTPVIRDGKPPQEYELITDVTKTIPRALKPEEKEVLGLKGGGVKKEDDKASRAGKQSAIDFETGLDAEVAQATGTQTKIVKRTVTVRRPLN